VLHGNFVAIDESGIRPPECDLATCRLRDVDVLRTASRIRDGEQSTQEALTRSVKGTTPMKSNSLFAPQRFLAYFASPFPYSRSVRQDDQHHATAKVAGHTPAGEYRLSIDGKQSFRATRKDQVAQS